MSLIKWSNENRVLHRSPATSGRKDGLKLLGIQGKESAWFSSYLNGCKQTVEKEHIEELENIEEAKCKLQKFRFLSKFVKSRI